MNTFDKAMAKHSDSELVEITTVFRKGYQVDAVKAAEEELKKRNLTVDRLADAHKEIEAKEQARSDKENEPLQIYWIVLTFIFPGVMSLLIAGALKAEGYERRHKEIWRYTLYGFIFYIGFFALMFVFFRILN